MHYHLRHTTTYRYSGAAPVGKNMLRIKPHDGPGQRLHAFSLAISPEPSYLDERIDYFGNTAHHFAISTGLKELEITAQSKVEVTPGPPPDIEASTPWEQLAQQLRVSPIEPGRLQAFQLALPSPRVVVSDALADYARPSFPPGRPVLVGARDLTTRINNDFSFDPHATNVSTPTDEVLRMRRGVCQDFAHLSVGCLRSLGLPARYVSGYVRTEPPPGRPRLVGADASHAWIGVYDESIGWVDFDPTNDSMPAGDHVRLAWGRDYGDICPVQGVFVGGGAHTVEVAVDVVPQDEQVVGPAPA